MPLSCDLLITRARLMSSNGWSEPQSIAVNDGRISEMGPPRPNELASAARILDAGGQLAIPGFINGHTHTHNALLRATGDNRWLELHILRMCEASDVWEPDDYYAAAALSAVEMIRTGTTSAIDMVLAAGARWQDKMNAVFRAYEDVGLAVTIVPVLSDLPFSASIGQLADLLPPGASEELDALSPSLPIVEQVDRLESLLESRRGMHSLVGVGVGPLIPALCTDQLLELIGSLALRWDLPIQTHCLESKLQALASLEPSGATTIDRLARLGLLGPRVSLAHGVWLTGRDMDIIAEAGATIIHCPASNLKLGSGIAPVHDFLERGVRVQLGTDGVASSDNQNMFQAMWLAALLSHGLTANPDQWLTARDVFRLATCSRLPQHESSGILEVGAKADIVLLDSTTTFLNPLVDPMLALVYSEVSRSVRSVVVQGRVVLEEGLLPSVREAELAEAVNRAWNRFARRQAKDSLVSRLRPDLLRIQQEVAKAPYLVQRHPGIDRKDEHSIGSSASRRSNGSWGGLPSSTGTFED